MCVREQLINPGTRQLEGLQRKRVHVGGEILARFRVGHRSGRCHVEPETARDHLRFKAFPKIRERELLAVQDALHRVSRGESVLRREIPKDQLKLVVRQGVSQLLAALHDEPLVDRCGQNL